MVAFFAAAQWLSFIEATAIYVVTTLLVVIIIGFGSRRLPYLSLIFGAFVIGGGGLSILFDYPDILIFADTIYFFSGIAAILWFLKTDKTLVERLFGHTFALTPRGWQLLNWQWILVFSLAGISNEIVRAVATPEWWIGFQFWRGVGIVLLTIGNLYITHHYRDEAVAGAWGIRRSESAGEVNKPQL